MTETAVSLHPPRPRHPSVGASDRSAAPSAPNKHNVCAKLVNEGKLLAKAGMWSEARRLFREALRLDAKNLDALLWLGAIVDDVDESAALLAEAFYTAPWSRRANAGLAWARERQAARSATALPMPTPRVPLPGPSILDTLQQPVTCPPAPPRSAPPPTPHTTFDWFDTPTITDSLVEAAPINRRPTPPPTIDQPTPSRAPHRPPSQVETVFETPRPVSAPGEAPRTSVASTETPRPAETLRPAETPRPAVASAETPRPAAASAEAPRRRSPSQTAIDLIAQGQAALDLERFGAAIRALEAAHREEPTSIEALLLLGLAYYRADRLKDAEGAYRMILAMEPTHAEAHANLGVIAVDRGQTGTAENEFRAALDCDPALDEVRLALADLLHQAGRLDDAVAEWRYLADQQPDIVELRVKIADCYAAAERHEDAAGAYADALTLGDDPSLRLRLGRSLRASGRPGAAIAHLHAACRAPNSPASWYAELAQALLDSGREPEAASVIEKALSFAPNDIATHEAAARLRQLTHRQPPPRVNTTVIGPPRGILGRLHVS